MCGGSFRWLSICYEEENAKEFRVKCREGSCGKSFIYAKEPENFVKHMNRQHRDIALRELNNTTGEWKFFRTMTTKKNVYYMQCILCKYEAKITASDDDLWKHIFRAHNTNELLFYKERHWIWKYLIAYGDSSAKCIICLTKTVKLSINTTELKDHIEKEHKDKWHVMLAYETLQAGTNRQSWNYLATKNKWLKKCYEDPSNFRAKCKLCKRSKLYVKIENFKTHVAKHHVFTDQLERGNVAKTLAGNNLDFSYFRYSRNKKEIQCIFCYTVFQRRSVTCYNDMFTHSKEHSSNISKHDRYIIKQHYVLKYIKQTADYATCRICDTYVDFECNMILLKKHWQTAHTENFKRIQEDLKQEAANGQAVPSTSHENWKKNDHSSVHRVRQWK
nr:PREDICTED: uncharacterized protein LOC105671091 [Linepithema humile]